MSKTRVVLSLPSVEAAYDPRDLLREAGMQGSVFMTPHRTYGDAFIELIPCMRPILCGYTYVDTSNPSWITSCIVGRLKRSG